MTIEIIHADARDVPDDLIATCDAQIVDPPYSAHVHRNAQSSGAPRDLGFASLDDVLRARIASAAALVRTWSIVFSDFEGSHGWRVAAEGAGAEWIRLTPWIRWSQPQYSGDRPPSGAEAVIALHSGRARKAWWGSGSVCAWTHRSLRGREKHPTEKPLDLMLALVSAFTSPGDAVLDLCAGSGATAQACRLLGRDCVAVERDATWASSARARVTSPLSARDAARATEWVASVEVEARDAEDGGAATRAQHRLEDAARVRGAL